MRKTSADLHQQYLGLKFSRNVRTRVVSGYRAITCVIHTRGFFFGRLRTNLVQYLERNEVHFPAGRTRA